MKIRTLIAAAMSVALLTVFIAAPVSAGGPATYKVGARGVEFAVGAIATNCPSMVDTSAPRQATTRTVVDAALKTKLAARAESSESSESTRTPCGKGVQAEPGTDYYDVWAMTSRFHFGQAGSGYEFTGLGVYGPITEVVWTAFIWSDHHQAWHVTGGDSFLLADELDVGEDLAYGSSSTWIPRVGWLDVGCVAIGAWYRASETITGGVDPGDGWTVEETIRGRSCYGVVSIDDVDLVNVVGLQLTRTVVTMVDVYPYPW